MRVNQFLRLVVERTRQQLPARRRDFDIRARFTLVQLFYARRTVHYEVWVRGQNRVIEIGLHFESDRVTNAGLLAYFREAPRAFEIKDTLGAEVEAEQWTESWARVHELLPYTQLDAATAEQVANHLAQMIATLQPMLERALAKTAREKSG